MEETLYTIAEVAEKLRLHRNTVNRLILTRKLGAYVFGTQYRISEPQLQAYIKEHTIITEKSQ